MRRSIFALYFFFAVAFSNSVLASFPGGVDSAPPAPTNVAVPATSSNGAYSLTWTPPTQMLNFYEIWESKNGASNVLVATIPITLPTYSTTKSYSFSGKSDASYKYTLKACNRGDVSTLCSSAASGTVVVGAPPVVPTNVHPTPSQSIPHGSSITYKWKGNSKAIKYDFFIYDRTKAAITYRNQNIVASSCPSNNCSIKPSLNLPISNDHVFRVRAYHTTGWSAWSATYFNVTNNLPTANAGSDKSVNEKTSVTLSGSGSDPDGNITSYKWTQISGTSVSISNSTSSTASFTAPSVSSNTALTFQLKVTDSHGGTDTDTVKVTVKNVNTIPVANAGANKTGNEKTLVTLSGSGTDSDGSITAYKWTQLSGTSVAINNSTSATASFTAPSVSADTSLTFQLKVTDNNGATDTDNVTVTIKNVLVNPVAEAGSNTSKQEGERVYLYGSGSDSDGNITAYKWTQVLGSPVYIRNSTSATAYFTAPSVTSDITLVFRLTVTDNDGLTHSDTVNATIVNINEKPVANAGPNQTQSEHSTVTLSGSGTDVDGTIKSYQWTQTSGPAVSLINANKATATFTPPSITANTTLRFTLRVTDDDNAYDTDTIDIHITNVNEAPVSDAGEDKDALEGSLVTLDGSGSHDAEGPIASYLWELVLGPEVTITDSDKMKASFAAPQIDDSIIMVFRLTVTDSHGESHHDVVNITITPKNDPPVISDIVAANSHVKKYPDGHSKAGETYTGDGYSPAFEVVASDEDESTLSYQWSIVGGEEYFNYNITETNEKNYRFNVKGYEGSSDGVYITIRATVTDSSGLSSYLDKPVHINKRPVFNVLSHNATGTRNGYIEFVSDISQLEFSGDVADQETHVTTLYRYLRRYHEPTKVWSYWDFVAQSWTKSTNQNINEFTSGNSTWSVINKFGENGFPAKQEFQSTEYRYSLMVGGPDTDAIWGYRSQYFYINAKPEITEQDALSIDEGSSLSLTTDLLTINDADDATGHTLWIAQSSENCTIANSSVNNGEVTPDED